MLQNMGSQWLLVKAKSWGQGYLPCAKGQCLKDERYQHKLGCQEVKAGQSQQTR